MPHTELNPDEVVALGRRSPGRHSRRRKPRHAVCWTSLLSRSGIETMGGVMSKIIPRNSTIPASASERFTTFVDGQTNVKIHVLQGERELSRTAGASRSSISRVFRRCLRACR